MTNKTKLKVGLIGVGHIGRFHVRHLSQHPNWNCVGIYDLKSEQSLAVAKEFSVPQSTDYHDLLNKADAIFITCPTKFHFAYAEKAIEQGKHVFIEKPITQTLEEGDLTEANADLLARQRYAWPGRGYSAWLLIHSCRGNPER